MFDWKIGLQLVKEYSAYVQWGSLIGKTLLWAFLLFTIGLLLVIFLRKYINVKRGNKWWQLIAYLWFVGIPLFMGYSGAKYGFLTALEKNLVAVVPDIINEGGTYLVESESSPFVAFLTDGGYDCHDCDSNFLYSLTPNNAIDIGVAFFYDYYTNTLDTLSSSDKTIVAKTAIALKSIISVKIISSLLKSTLKKQLESKLHFDKEITEELLDTKFKAYLQEGFLKIFTETIIETIFSKLKKSVWSLMGLVLLLPFAEIIFAHYYMKRQVDNVGLE